jgi:hypothetical protein
MPFAKLLRIARLPLTELVHAVREYRKLSDQPLTLRGAELTVPSLGTNRSSRHPSRSRKNQVINHRITLGLGCDRLRDALSGPDRETVQACHFRRTYRTNLIP